MYFRSEFGEFKKWTNTLNFHNYYVICVVNSQKTLNGFIKKYQVLWRKKINVDLEISFDLLLLSLKQCLTRLLLPSSENWNSAQSIYFLSVFSYIT